MDSTSTNGTHQLEMRINNPDTAAALNRLMDRLDSLEQSVNALTDAVGQAPGMVAMAGDLVDETYRKASESGIDLEERTAAGLQLLNKLTEPKMVEQLQQLLDMAGQAPGMAAMAGDIVDNAYRDATASGIDLEQRATTGLQLLNKLTEPKMMDQLQQLLDMADQAPKMAAMVGDIVDDAYGSALASGVDLEALARQSMSAAMQVNTVVMSDEFNALMNSKALDPKALAVIGSAAEALVTSQQMPSRQISPLGLLSAMRKPEVQKALGFLMNFAEQFGKNI